MDTLSVNFDSDATELASWNRPRTSEELRSFIDTHHAMLPDGINID